MNDNASREETTRIPTPTEESSGMSEITQIQIDKRTLDVNRYAEDSLRGFIRQALSELLSEADHIARLRGGNDIQSGDVELAKNRIEGKAKGKFWALALGCGFFGAGIQGLADAIVTAKGIDAVILYVVFILLGIVLVFFSAPQR